MQIDYMDTSTSFVQAHLENQLWANELDFFREEILILEKHLQGLLERNNRPEMVERADYFRDQFSVYKQRIIEFENEIAQAEQQMAIHAKSNQSTDLEEVNVADQYQFRERAESFRADYLKLKMEFRRFESEWM